MNLLNKILILTLFFPLVSHSKTYSKVFKEPYDLVWKSTLIALANYPLDKNSQETGEIETSILKGNQAWVPYHKELLPKEEYKLSLQILKFDQNGQSLVKVVIDKKSSLKGDFLRSTKEIESDGIEESVLLYRISRELIIDKIMDKTFN